MHWRERGDLATRWDKWLYFCYFLQSRIEASRYGDSSASGGDSTSSVPEEEHLQVYGKGGFMGLWERRCVGRSSLTSAPHWPELSLHSRLECYQTLCLLCLLDRERYDKNVLIDRWDSGLIESIIYSVDPTGWINHRAFLSCRLLSWPAAQGCRVTLLSFTGTRRWRRNQRYFPEYCSFPTHGFLSSSLFYQKFVTNEQERLKGLWLFSLEKRQLRAIEVLKTILGVERIGRETFFSLSPNTETRGAFGCLGAHRPLS